MNLLEIEQIVRTGGHSLSDSLHLYWPSTGANNEIPESNISLHLGRAMLNAGLSVFSSAHTDGAANVFIDLLALDHRSSSSIVCEFKRVTNAAGASRMATDLDRILAFHPLADQTLRHSNLTLNSKVGLLAGTTWRREIADWFTTDDDTMVDTVGGALDQIWARLQGIQPIWGAVVLEDFHRAANLEARSHWLVYALFNCPTP